MIGCKPVYEIDPWSSFNRLVEREISLNVMIKLYTQPSLCNSVVRARKRSTLKQQTKCCMWELLVIQRIIIPND